MSWRSSHFVLPSCVGGSQESQDGMLDQTLDSEGMEDLPAAILGHDGSVGEGAHSLQGPTHEVLQPINNNIDTNAPAPAIIPTRDDIVICNESLLLLLKNSPSLRQ